MKEFINIANDKFMKHTRDEWAEIFTKNDIVCEKLVHYQEVADDPQAAINNYLEDITFSSGTTVKLPRVPLIFSEYPSVKHIEPTGAVGRDTVKILKDIGYTDNKIQQLKQTGSIKC